ncbi:SLC13 family permease [Maribacter sp. PR1]|uniref:SLC13 family permease n=1 Tax=Maribacter cobaltidurans TaxID=1178778 RepID=A0ABU7IQS1_9FLAO|nr:MULTISPECIES: SLC13 family permease [Maribacter]MDC6387772.1 SLC13 family permease [Maribacter sp. PR1]MEE1975161.1 SLC13 family permease [Maribacter cobaltidurans]
MTWEIITVFLIIGAVIVLFAFDIFPMDKISFFIIGALLLSGLVSPEEAVSGFSNKAVITILCLMILAIGLEENGVISWFAKGLKVLKNWPAVLVMIVIMMLSGGISAFISSTAVVIVFIKIVAELKAKYGLLPGKLLLPISFASILGGSCTLMGTSTNLIVNNIFSRYTDDKLGFFEFSLMGLAFLGTSILIIVLFYSFLPKGKGEQLSEKYNLNKYILTLKVNPDSPLVGIPLEKSFMFKDPEITVLRITHNNLEENILNPKLKIRIGDVILLHCSLENLQKMRAEGYFDLEIDETTTSTFSKGTSVEKVDREEGEDDSKEKVETVLLELLLLPGSRFLGKTLTSLKKMIVPRAIPIAINKRKPLTNLKSRLHLDDKTITKLKVGDRLLIQTSASFIPNFENSNNLAVLNQFDGGMPSTPYKRNLSLIILLVTILLAATGVLEIMPSVVLGTLTMLLFKCIELNNIYEKINWQIIFLLAGMIPLGVAMTNAGADLWLTQELLNLLEGQKPIIIIGVLFLTTMLFSAVVSNNATAIIMAPIAISLANGLALDVKPFILCVMFAANFSFFTPLGYQTNALVYSMGIYKFKHFLILGGVISFVLLILGTLLLSTML